MIGVSCSIIDKVQLTFYLLIIPILTIGQRIDYDSTFNSNGLEFRVQQIQLAQYMSLLKITKSKTTILADTLDFFIDIKLIDFNKDHATDILITHMGHANTQSLYLFDYSNSKFRKVLDFEAFPNAKEITGKEEGFYYSYRRSGCADNYWTSDLFKIIDFKTIHIAQIFGDGCEEPKQVKVYEVRQNKRSLLQILSYELVEESNDYKWGFIENYWTLNYSNFK